MHLHIRGVLAVGGYAPVKRAFRKIPLSLAVSVVLLLLHALHSAAYAQSPRTRIIAPVRAAETHASAKLAGSYGKLPLSFEANQGQTDPHVRFLSRGNGYSLFLTAKEAVLALHKPAMDPEAGNHGDRLPGHSGISGERSFKTDVVRMQLAGARSDALVTGKNKLPGVANYFIGNDQQKWQTSMPTYGQVEYRHVYPGVDLTYYGNQQQLEYDFVVAPNADPSPIRLHFAGAQKLKLASDGSLEVIAKNGDPMVQAGLTNVKLLVSPVRFTRPGTGVVVPSFSFAWVRTTSELPGSNSA